MLRLPTLSQGLLLDGKALLRAISMGAAGFLMMQSAACSANMATAKGGVEFLCSVQGSNVLFPKQTSASVCRIFKDKIDGVLRRPVTIVRSFSNSNGHNQIKLDIRLSKRGSAVALLEQRNGGKI